MTDKADKKKREQLQETALESASFRGHKMSEFQRLVQSTKSESICLRCSAYVQVDTCPPANGIDIGGSAIALNCEGGYED